MPDRHRLVLPAWRLAAPHGLRADFGAPPDVVERVAQLGHRTDRAHAREPAGLTREHAEPALAGLGGPAPLQTLSPGSELDRPHPERLPTPPGYGSGCSQRGSLGLRPGAELAWVSELPSAR